MYHTSGFGPIFGGGHDLKIVDNSNANQSSYCNPKSYTGHTANLLAGSQHFTPDEVEVYQWQ